MEANGFEKGKHMGLQAHHNFAADPEIPGYTIMLRRITCLCRGCRERFTKPIGECYKNPCDDCVYFGVYKGYNNWKKISLRERKDCDQDTIVMAQEWTLKKIGERMAVKIITGQYGAYLVDDAQIKYSLVQWTSQPWKVNSGTIKTKCSVAHIGEYVCKGLWFNNVDRAPRWYTLSEDEVIVRFQCILCSDIELVPHSSDNDLPPHLNWSYRALVLATMKQMKLHENAHNQLIDSVSLWEGLDYEEKCNVSDSGESGCESDKLDLDESDVDIDASSSSDDSDWERKFITTIKIKYNLCKLHPMCSYTPLWRHALLAMSIISAKKR